MSGLTMGHVGAFGPLGPRRDRYGSFGLGGARSSADTFERAAERWRRDNCVAKGAAYVNEPASSGCHFHANLAILAAKQMAMARIGLKGHSVADVEQAIISGQSLGGFSPSQLSAALNAGQTSTMSMLGITVPPKAVPRPPRPGSLAEGALLQRLEGTISRLVSARGAEPAPPSTTALTLEQQALLARMTAQEKEEARRAAALAAVRAAQVRQRSLRTAQAALPPPRPIRRPRAPGEQALVTRGRMEPWQATGMLLLGAGALGTIIYAAFGKRRR